MPVTTDHLANTPHPCYPLVTTPHADHTEPWVSYEDAMATKTSEFPGGAEPPHLLFHWCFCSW